MNKKLKIIFLLIGIVVVSGFLFVSIGFYTMDIEDHYGDNQDFFYKSKYGDIAINRDTREFGKIEKSWTRVYITDKGKKVDLWSWLNKRDLSRCAL